MHVSKRKPDSALGNALLDLCRTGGMKLTIEALITSENTVMDILTGAPPPADPIARGDLARWIVATVVRQTNAFGSARDRGIAQAALPTEKALHGMNVDQRVKWFAARDVFTKHEYWQHRGRVVDEIAGVLMYEYPKFHARPPIPQSSSLPTIFLAGYHHDSSMDATARALGIVLDQLPIRVTVCSMASSVVMTAGYAFAEQADFGGPASLERYTLYRRTESRRPQPITRYLGRTECLPGSLNEARVTILERADT